MTRDAVAHLAEIDEISGLERAQLGLERRQAVGRDVVGRTRRPWLSGCG